MLSMLSMSCLVNPVPLLRSSDKLLADPQATHFLATLKLSFLPHDTGGTLSKPIESKSNLLFGVVQSTIIHCLMLFMDNRWGQNLI